MRYFVVIAFALAAGCAGGSPPRLKPVDLRSSLYLARHESHTTISPSGRLHNVTTWNKTYGPDDRAGPSKTEVRDGQLTSAQMVELVRMFRGWDSLSGAYGGVPDGGDVEIKYGDKRVTGGSGLPKQILTIEQRIRQLAESMPRTSGR